jgi:hypothetical protein
MKLHSLSSKTVDYISFKEKNKTKKTKQEADYAEEFSL